MLLRGIASCAAVSINGVISAQCRTRRTVDSGEGFAPCVSAQETQHGEPPEHRQDRYQKQSQEPRRWAHPANNQRRDCSNCQHHAERSVHRKEALGIDERLFGDNQCEQTERHGTRKQPRRLRRRARIVGMPDEADNRGAGCSDR